MGLWVDVVSFFDTVPAGVWVGAMVANLILTAATWSVARRRIRRAGERAAKSEPMTGVTAAKDTALTVATLVPAGLFLVYAADPTSSCVPKVPTWSARRCTGCSASTRPSES